MGGPSEACGRLRLVDDERLREIRAVGVSTAALQWPAEAQDTELMAAFPPWLSPTVPGTSIAPRQCPFVSLTTIACSWLEAVCVPSSGAAVARRAA